MTTTTAMLDTYPQPINLDRTKLATTIDALIACSEACTACADACLSEDMVADLAKCIRTNLDCADICATTARVLSRHTGYDANISRSLLEACAAACRACGDECAGHADMHQHCRICADACRHCERVCRDLMATMT
jgi:hypothetical protein